MTSDDDDLTLRPITGPEELELFTRLPYTLDHELAADLADGHRRPEWMWVALRGDRLVARAAWWSRPGDDRPELLDALELDDHDPRRLDAGVRLLRAALPAMGTPRPAYTRYLPPDWRDDPAVRRTVEDRLAVLERTGARLFVERLRLQWEPGTPIPPPGDRLRFRPVGGADELITLMTAVLDGTLDAHSLDDLTRMTPAEAARAQYDEELARFTSPRDWWRIATLPDGTPVGFVIPAHNGYNPTIAYLGILPAFRGRGLIAEVLAEGTRILAATGVDRIRAATDVGNTPMAAAFTRAGYATFERQIHLTWPGRP